MQVLRPAVRCLAARNIPLRNIPTPSPAGCSYWAYRTYATKSQSPPRENDIDDGDLFGDAETRHGTSRQASDQLKVSANQDQADYEFGEVADDDTPSSSKDQLLHRPKLPSSIKMLNRILSRQRAVEIPEHELEEKFVRGRGPGGQAINKTNSSVSLTHIPTGIRIQSQPTRSREENRKVARRILGERLEVLRTTGQLPGYDIPGIVVDIPQDDGVPRSKKETKKLEEKVLSGAYTKKEVKEEKLRIRKANKKKKARRKYGKKGEMEEDEGEGDTINAIAEVPDGSSSTRV
ncbi:hypothetical protein I302_106144 [Kwoniella bestiolae CBS 10118]|uniref:Prokaryotic-type class I peptide chain release factors domain-containing protein n=1 Tax=Kwoniella bestiolae CBS 10118 TaxID=1296100 RepID=A0A1B9G348_9TREE|nr:hypothetical protein I302_05267 [Kwoniella bestiolae CBS 10118]OCF25447.1 hypothetical protein I302_05267 [Kwoniella bestiolae CBS 10118]